MTAALLVVVSLLLVLASGVFVAAEFAFVTVDRSPVERDAQAGDATARGLLLALRSLSTQLSGAQVGITVTNLAIGFLAEPAIADLVDGPLEAVGLPEGAVRPVALAIGLVLSSLATMIFGELVPKNLAIARPMRTARATQRFQRRFTTADGLADPGAQRLGQRDRPPARDRAPGGAAVGPQLDRAGLPDRPVGRPGTLDAETAELMERSVEFGTRTAGEIMTPRVRTHSLEEGDRASVVIELARETGHSRFPVLDADDTVVGTVHVKHAVALPVHERATTRVKHLMVKPIVVPDSLRLDPLLALLREDGFQMAVVLDEYGGHAGIVTLEDVVEEIVGDIADEHDPLGSRARQRRDGSWSLSGLLRPDEVEDLTGIVLPEHEDYDTVAGPGAPGARPDPGRRRRGRGAAGARAGRRRGRRGRAGPPYRRAAVEHMDGLRIDRVRLSVRVEPGEPS